MITGVVLARNEESNIADCLRTLRPHVEELILIDMESDDRTVELARPFTDKVLSHAFKEAFDSARNVAIPAARHEWLWFLDADERVSPATGRAVRRLIATEGGSFEAVLIPFKSYFCGKWIQHCGWWPGYTMPRVLKRGHFRFADQLHGGVDVDGRQVALPPDPDLAIEHHSYLSVEHYLKKFNQYTNVEARQLYQAGGPGFDWGDGVRAMTRDLWSYFERQDGWRDGQHGWILSWLAGQYRWFSHAKLLDLDPQAANAAPPADLDEVIAEICNELGSLRVAAKPAPHDVLVRTPLWDPSGYAEDGRFLLQSLSRGERAVHAREIPWSDRRVALPAAKAALLRSLARSRPSPPYIAVTNCIPSLVQPDPGAACNILRTTFETDRIPDAWCDGLAAFDEIWVYAEATAVAFRQGGAPPEKLRVVPSGVDTDVFRPDGARRDLPKALRGRFVFLSVLDWQLRKGWDVLLCAYCQEFSAAESVGLLLKITRSHGPSLEGVREQIGRLLRPLELELSDRPEIVIDDALLSSEELGALYRSVDALVLPSRGEGWGLPLLEAMATGKPVIGVEGSGNMAFMDRTNSELTPSVWADVPPQAAEQIPTYAGHRWREPNFDALRSAMRRVQRDAEHRAALGRKAVAHVRERFSFEAARLRAEEALLDVERKFITASEDEPPANGIRVQLEGEFFAGHSFSNINEHLAARLRNDKRLSLRIQRLSRQPADDRASPLWPALRQLTKAPPFAEPDVTIRHAFPPRFDSLPAGKWVHIQPWEFGALPRDWVEPMRRQVDEIWAPSRYVKDVYLRSGIDADRIQVIPWGVDPEVYHPEVPPLLLPCAWGFVFLFMGGAIERKGFDLAVEAYLREFTATDDVCLVIKDMGRDTFYRMNAAREAALERFQQTGTPAVLYLDRAMTEGQRASLYAACDCLLAPYRGEGFGLHVLEAMACGVPPIVTRGGATDDFVLPEDGGPLDAETVECDHDWRLCGVGTELHVGIDQLRQRMRSAFDDQRDWKRRGRLASDRIRAEYTWQATTEKMADRLSALAADGCPAATLAPPARRRTTLSLCVVTDSALRDAAETLSRARPFVDEIILLAASADERLGHIGREYGARVYQASGPISSLRNAAIRKASSDWLLLLEAGEYLDEDAFAALQTLLPDLDEVQGAWLLSRHGADPRIGWREMRLVRNRNEIEFTVSPVADPGPSIVRINGKTKDLGDRLEIRGKPASSWCDIDRHILETHQAAAFDPFWLGRLHVQAGNYFHAECYLQDSLAADGPHHDEALRLLAHVYCWLDDPIRRQETIDLLRQRRPDFATQFVETALV